MNASIAKKWQPKFMVNFSVREVVGPVTYKIKLPPSMRKAHNVFLISGKRKFNRREAYKELLSVFIDAGSAVEQTLIATLDSRKKNHRSQYLVRCEGDPPGEAIQMNKSKLPNCSELIKEFESLAQTTCPKRG